MAPPVAAKTARMTAAAKAGLEGRAAPLLRRDPAVSVTKIGAASIGLMTEKSEENASSANLPSAEENMQRSAMAGAHDRQK